ncbi:MAG TPA: nuclear transport factor 2 family protein [Bdellovibrionota bacterium]|jgi:steroid delta-isomerase-like uncharacterized protein|nr:nuclear transport factor 2 family protein [Bdellovibrionota bacterium]
MKTEAKNPKAVITEWLSLMNTHDADALAELYHPEATNLQVAIGTPLIGRDAIRNDFRDFFKNIPDTFTHVVNLFEDGEWAILEWSGGGLFQPTGKTFTLNGCGFFQIKAGKIHFQRGYWDKHTWFTQVGVPVE